MHAEVLENLEEEEACEGQGNKQQGIFNRPLTFEVLIHRVHKTDTECPAIEFLAPLTVHTLAQGVLQIGGEERGLPAR
ncbi:hypothetical protein D3C79_748670 [compost metagenome]